MKIHTTQGAIEFAINDKVEVTSHETIHTGRKGTVIMVTADMVRVEFNAGTEVASFPPLSLRKLSENPSPNRQLQWHDCCKSYYHKPTCPQSPLFALPNLADKYGPDCEAKMKLYLVAINRDNKVETVVTVTPNLTKAQQELLRALSDLDPLQALAVLDDFSNGVLTDNCSVTTVVPEIVVQLCAYVA